MTAIATQRAAYARQVTECGLCGSGNLEMVLSLGTSPPPCVMHPVGARPRAETSYPLELLRCADCTLVQLSVVIDPEVVFAPEFPYQSGNSQQLHRNFQELADSFGLLAEDDLVVDIGANDGTLLSKFDGCRTLGVEPTDQANHIKGAYIQAFFDEEIADRIVAEYGQAKVITACNVMAHVQDLWSVMRGIRKLLAPDGVFVAENHDVAAVLNGQWDMVYHEHLRFYSPHSFGLLLSQHGLGCTDWKRTSTHGGSFRMFAGHGQREPAPDIHQDWAALRGLAARQRRLIRRVLAAHGPVAGIGAPARATTFINYCGLDVQDIKCVYEVPGSDKIGRYIPGTGIPVQPETQLLNSDKGVAVLLSWHLDDIIIPKLRGRGYKAPVLVPLPSLHYSIT
ncbi:MAG TPA: class I SAM-dependent methyltransferase [Streptosporangiaceae bacterium]